MADSDARRISSDPMPKLCTAGEGGGYGDLTQAIIRQSLLHHFPHPNAISNFSKTYFHLLGSGDPPLKISEKAGSTFDARNLGPIR